MKKSVATALILLLSAPLFAEGENVTITPPEDGSISRQDGLAAWARIYEVASHPRCSNCHVGADNRPHGMNVNAGDSRIGAEYVQCSTCHAYREDVNDMPHAAPQVAMNWRLAPVEAEWFGKSSTEICEQLRDPERNGDRDHLELANHLDHDLILHWAWNPGGGREAAPLSLQEHVNDILAWGVAGFPCEHDE
jgi:hypothetical protein